MEHTFVLWLLLGLFFLTVWNAVAPATTEDDDGGGDNDNKNGLILWQTPTNLRSFCHWHWHPSVEMMDREKSAVA